VGVKKAEGARRRSERGADGRGLGNAELEQEVGEKGLRLEWWPGAETDLAHIEAVLWAKPGSVKSGGRTPKSAHSWLRAKGPPFPLGITVTFGNARL